MQSESGTILNKVIESTCWIAKVSEAVAVSQFHLDTTAVDRLWRSTGIHQVHVGTPMWRDVDIYMKKPADSSSK